MNPRNKSFQVPWNQRVMAGTSLTIVGIALVTFAAGCAATAGQHIPPPSASPTTPDQSFSISGTISPTLGGSGAIVQLSGAVSATTTASSSGAYTFTGLANGTYTVTPSHAGFTFAPGSANATIAGGNLTAINFTGTAQTFSISGTISATGGSGATVALSGAAAMSTTANGAGGYSFSGLGNGTYTVTPSHQGYTFSPNTQLATVNGSDVSGINFTATAQTTPTYTISGTITPASSGSGATVILDGAAGATTTANGSGMYSFSGLSNGTYTVSPNRSGFVFTPTQKSVTLNGSNVAGVNFAESSNPTHSVDLSWTATPSTVAGYNVYRSTVSGSQYVKINGGLLGATSFSDATVANGTTYYYVTTAVDSTNNESAYSNEAIASVP